MKNQIKKLLALTVVGASLLSIMPTGVSAAWKQNSTGWWNTKDSSWSTGWENINQKWYYFGGDGYMKTGWIKDDSGNWYYLNADGSMAKDVVVDGYKVDASGAYVEETIQIAPIVNTTIVNEQTQTKIEVTEEKPKETTTTKKKRRKSSSSSTVVVPPIETTTPAGAEVIVDEGFPITICYNKETLELAGSYVGTKDYKIFPGMPLEEAQSKYGIINTDGTGYGITSKYELILVSRKLKVEVTGEGAKLIKE